MEADRNRVDRLENHLMDCLARQKSNHSLSIKKLKTAVETGFQKLLRTELDVLVEEVDSKLNKIDLKIGFVAQMLGPKQEPSCEPGSHKEDKDYFSNRLDTLSKQIFVEMRNLKSELSAHLHHKRCSPEKQFFPV